MARDGSGRTRFRTAGILLGLGLGGFFDGIVLHQLLQWHHMVSHTDRWPMTTLPGLEANTLADGLFHAATYVLTLAGIFLLWRAMRDRAVAWSTRAFIGLMILGWGVFNVVEGVVDHHLLQVHRVREDVDNPLAWDIGFLIWGAAMIAIGWYLSREDLEREESSLELGRTRRA
jgi:uncharacterized membrane protein